MNSSACHTSKQSIASTHTPAIPDIQIPITGTYSYTDENGTQKNLCGAVDLGQIKTVGIERIVSSKVCDLVSEMEDQRKRVQT